MGTIACDALDWMASIGKAGELALPGPGARLVLGVFTMLIVL